MVMPEEAAPKRDGEPGVAEPSEPDTVAAGSHPSDAEPVTEPVAPARAEPVTERVALTRDEPVTEAVVEPVTEPVPPAASEAVTELVALAGSEPVTELVALAGSEAVTEPVALAKVEPAGQRPPAATPDTGAAGPPAPIWPESTGVVEAPVAPDGVPAMAGEKPFPLGRGGVPKMVAIAVGVVVLLLVGCGIGAVVLYLGQEKPTTAATGDCLKGNGINPGTRKTSHVSLTVVSCGDTSAKYKVAGRVENQPESAANADSRLCDPFAGTEFIYWQGVDGERGTVLCLMSNQPK
jgi:hypothetical protein